jgi:photosystem II PsbM protein
MSMGLPEVAGQALLVAGEGMEVSVAAYLAVLLGTFVPVVFLVTLYIQSESRKSATVDE